MHVLLQSTASLKSYLQISRISVSYRPKLPVVIFTITLHVNSVRCWVDFLHSGRCRWIQKLKIGTWFDESPWNSTYTNSQSTYCVYIRNRNKVLGAVSSKNRAFYSCSCVLKFRNIFLLYPYGSLRLLNHGNIIIPIFFRPKKCIKLTYKFDLSSL